MIKEALSSNNFNSDECAVGKFEELVNLTLKWSKSINITAHRDPETIIYKDIVDNLYLSDFISNYSRLDSASPNSIGIDMGSGAGFSGLVLMIANPQVSMAFLESDRKKINYTKEVCRKLLLSKADFIHARAESNPDLFKEKFHFSITRATWPLERYLKYGQYYVQNYGHSFYMSAKRLKNTNQLGQEYQGFADDEKYFYKIEPKGYERSIFSFKKVA
ncbi:MAG: class I SAM-dependent methyltransferase [Deltaproteobacteria bacterium]|nr:class I SAM-dependent methyltransferase [Deltaproteobacteria bacterium]